MSNKFNEYRKALVNFFVEESYTVYGSATSKKVNYLYSKDAEIKIIKIAIVKKQPGDKKDSQMEYLKTQIATKLETSEQSLNCLEIYLTDNFEDNLATKENNLIIVASGWDYLTHALHLEFPRLANLEDPELVNGSSGSKVNEDDFNIEDIKSPEDLKKRLGALNSQLRNGNAIATMIISILFLVGPIIVGFVSMFLVGGSMGGLFANKQVEGIQSLVFGGSTYSLTILGGQWWRILTYGFSSGTSLLTLALLMFVAWFGFRRLRLNELMMGTWKMLGSFFIAYLLTGFFLTVLNPTVISGADFIAFAIVMGMIALNAGGSKSVLATTAKSQIIAPIILIVFIGLMNSFSNNNFATISMVVGFIAGGSMSFMFTYDYKELNWRLSIGVILLLALILLPVAFLIVPSYVPGIDNSVVFSLRTYLNLNWISVDQANNIVHKIGWNIDWNKTNDFVWWTLR